MGKTKTPESLRLTSLQEDFLTKEAEKLNTELEKHLAETRSREKYSLSIIAGVAAWLFTHASADIRLLKAISLIPVITTLFLGISTLFIYRNINWIGDYLLRIENHFLADSKDEDGNLWGWEKFFNDKNRKRCFVNVTRLSWFIQLALALSLFFLVLCKDHLLLPKTPEKSTVTQENSGF